jgi:hypothetical protein
LLNYNINSDNYFNVGLLFYVIHTFHG